MSSRRPSSDPGNDLDPSLVHRLEPLSLLRIVRERREGKTAYAIARDLNKDAVPTAQGARAWSQATVRALLMREGVH